MDPVSVDEANVPGTGSGAVPPDPALRVTRLDLPAILVVDDDAPSRAMVRRYLKKAGLTNPVVEIADGDSAVDHLAGACGTADGAGIPALVLLDLRMPGLDGLDVLAWIRDQTDLVACPVVVLSSSAEMPDFARAEALGVAAYLVKPVGFAALTEVLRRLTLPWALVREGPDR